MNAPQPGRSQWIGRSVRRLEDPRLLTGQGRFTDDQTLPGQLHCAFVRSPHAHARIGGIDVADAQALPGVVAVFTGQDLVNDGIAPLPFNQMHKRPDGKPVDAAPRRALTSDVARFVGDAVAMVVAETRQQARDGAEAVVVDWEPLDAVADSRDAARDDAPQVWPAACLPGFGNIAAYYQHGDAAAVDAAFASAVRVSRVAIRNPRVVSNPLEPRGANAQYDAASQSFTLWCPTQNTHLVCAQLADVVFKVPKERMRVICTDMGGGFGTRGYPYPEYVAVAYAARRTGRPVKWLGDRSEIFLTDAQGRDNWTEAEVAMDAEHRFLALRVRTFANIGAYVSHYGASVPAMSGARAVSGPYRITLAHHEVRMQFTHTAPVDAYRGAGRPEMGYLLERLVSRAALDAGIDPVEIRRRNLVTAAEMPWRNAVGLTYDCGDFVKVMDECLAAADWKGFAARQAESRARGLLRGRGLASYVEITGSAKLDETVQVDIADGKVTVFAGTQPMGQGLWTSYAQIIAERLGIAPEAVVLVNGDTARVKSGAGSGGSRSLQVGGTAVLAGANAAVDAGKTLAADALEAAAADIEFDERTLPHRRDRSLHRTLRTRRPRTRRTHRGERERRGVRADVAERLPGGGGGDRSGNRRGEGRAPYRGRRHRPRDEPDDRAWPGRGRHRPGPRPGADGGMRARRIRPAHLGLVHGLRHAARRRRAEPRSAFRRVGADRAQHPRRERRRRSRLPRCDAGDRECGDRCAGALRGERHRYAGDEAKKSGARCAPRAPPSPPSYFACFAQESRSVTVRLKTGLPGRVSRRSATK